MKLMCSCQYTRKLPTLHSNSPPELPAWLAFLSSPFYLRIWLIKTDDVSNPWRQPSFLDFRSAKYCLIILATVLECPMELGVKPFPWASKNMNIGALPRRCRPFNLTESDPLKSKAKHNNGVPVPFFPSAHERQCAPLGFMDQPFQVQMTRAPVAKLSTAWRFLMWAA